MYTCFIPQQKRKVKAKRDMYDRIILNIHLLKDAANKFLSSTCIDITRKDSFKDSWLFSTVPLTFLHAVG